MKTIRVMGVLLAGAMAVGMDVPPALIPFTEPPTAGMSAAPATAPAVVVPKRPVEFEVQLSPAGETRPAVMHPLVVRYEDQVPGNAVDFYDTAVLSAPPQLTEEFWDRVDLLRWEPLGEVKGADVQMCALPANAIELLRQGSLRTEVVWPARPRGEQQVRGNFPQLAWYSTGARRLGIAIRWDIHEGRFEEAIGRLRIGYALAHAFSRQEESFAGSVGIGIAEEMNRRVLDFISAPGAPNLYWALRDMPTPLIGYRQFVAADAGELYVLAPELKRLREGPFAMNDWNAFRNRMAEPRGLTPYGRFEHGEDKLGWPERSALVDKASHGAVRRAREFLAEGGMSQSQVDALQEPELVVQYLTRSLDDWNQRFGRCTMLPVAEARAALAKTDDDFEHSLDSEANFLMPLMNKIDPDYYVRFFLADRDIAFLEVMEALRLHAAANHGELPKTLAEITEVPVPGDPISGRAFEYRRTETGAGAGAELVAEDPIPRTKRNGLRVTLSMRGQ